ncbi:MULTISPECIES: hypothetical protein [Rhodococcus erythropolis group]|nr:MULTISPECIES: hypothetical protein [Rhodococcus erythropolis group]
MTQVELRATTHHFSMANPNRSDDNLMRLQVGRVEAVPRRE